MSGDDEKIRIGISACLLGEKVRYDGGHKLDPFIRDTLGCFFEYISICPEVECGLPVPRESMRLAGDPEHPRLVTIGTVADHTDRIFGWGKKRLRELESEDLCGYIFKSGSPSCGMARVMIYTDKGVKNSGTGIWVGMFMDRFPLIPVVDENRLHNPVIRENFIESVFVFRQWHEF